MVININKLADELKVSKPDLITRMIGRIMYKSVKVKINNINENEVALLDFEGIKVIDSSFIDEFLVKLIMGSRKSSSPYYIKLTNISEITENNIELVFTSYSKYTKEKIVVITENICQNNSFFIGTLSDRAKDLIEYLRVNRSATITDLVKFTELDFKEVEIITEELFSIRIIRKDDDGLFLAV